MKFGPGPKFDKGKKTNSKNLDDNVMSEHYDVFVIFRICGQFGAVQRPHSGHRVCEVTFSVMVTFCLTETENRTKVSLTQLSPYCFE